MEHQRYFFFHGCCTNTHPSCKTLLFQPITKANVTHTEPCVCVCTHVCIIGVWRQNTLHMQSPLYMQQQARLAGEEAAHKYHNRLLKEHGFQSLVAVLTVGWNLCFVCLFVCFLVSI